MSSTLLDRISRRSGSFPDVPARLPDLPRGLPDVPARLPDLPGSLPDLPRGLPDLPASLPELPGGLPDLPAISPDALGTMLQEAGWVRDVTRRERRCRDLAWGGAGAADADGTQRGAEGGGLEAPARDLVVETAVDARGAGLVCDQRQKGSAIWGSKGPRP